MRLTRGLAIYALLAAGWLVIVVWQVAEHRRVRATTRQVLLNRAHDISTSLGVVIRSQRRFATVLRPRLEGALKELAKATDLLAVALLSPGGDVVASAGEAGTESFRGLAPGSLVWGRGTLTVAALVELGPEPGPPGPPSRGSRRRPREPIEAEEEKKTTAVLWTPPEYPREGNETGATAESPPPTDTSARPPEQDRKQTPDTPPGAGPDPAPPPQESTTGGASGAQDGALTDAEPDPAAEEARRERRREFWQRLRSNHPYWLSQERFRDLYEKQGLHTFALLMATDALDVVNARDLWLRLATSLLTLMAVAGLGVAWRGRERSSELEVRLVRARALNAYLRELNVAAAGLAHETRNPLNIVRGIAQLIAKDADAPASIRDHTATVVEEVDRVTNRLNEFIDYSKPREAKLAPTNLAAVVRDVERTLETDREDKGITFALDASDLTIKADEGLLRQVFFNLLINAFQAVGEGGHVLVAASLNADQATIEIRDDGPGVPDDARESIFRPYFTLSDQGTGLGLAVVKQIVLAHHWDIEYLPGENGGSVFRISGIDVARKA